MAIQEPPRVRSARADLEETYRRRFTPREVVAKDGLWRPIASYLQRYIGADAAVLDVACDQGAFIRHVSGRERWATDIRDVAARLPADIRFVQVDGLRMSRVLPQQHFDAVFMSNYLEHLDSPEAVLQQLREAHAVLRVGGTLIVLQPNIRLTGGRYWDFLDHRTPLTENTLREAAELVGFVTRRVVTRFLPYSTKSRLPQSSLLVSAYLRFPPAWWVMGKQSLYIATRSVAGAA